MAKLNLSVVTQESHIFDGEVEQVSLPSMQGEITVLPHHSPLMAAMSAGEVVIWQGGQMQRLVVSPGFIQVMHNSVTVLADSAIHERDVNEQAALEARKAAEVAMADAVNDTEVAIVEGLIERISVELRAVQRRRVHSHRSPYTES
jgi:F-type H+-transporting ATPase subunit epsilon